MMLRCAARCHQRVQRLKRARCNVFQFKSHSIDFVVSFFFFQETNKLPHIIYSVGRLFPFRNQNLRYRRVCDAGRIGSLVQYNCCVCTLTNGVAAAVPSPLGTSSLANPQTGSTQLEGLCRNLTLSYRCLRFCNDSSLHFTGSVFTH